RDERDGEKDSDGGKHWRGGYPVRWKNPVRTAASEQRPSTAQRTVDLRQDRSSHTLAGAVDLENLRALLQVVDSGSIQGASRHLGLPRSSLRRRTAGLEAEVGAPLRLRDAGGVRLPAAGSVVVEQGRRVLESSRALLADARAAAEDATGILRIIEP